MENVKECAEKVANLLNTNWEVINKFVEVLKDTRKAFEDLADAIDDLDIPKSESDQKISDYLKVSIGINQDDVDRMEEFAELCDQIEELLND